MAGWTSLHVGCARLALFEQPCISDARLARMRSYEAANITSPARSIEVDERKVNRG
jgi:hypothetical protein